MLCLKCSKWTFPTAGVSDRCLPVLQHAQADASQWKRAPEYKRKHFRSRTVCVGTVQTKPSHFPGTGRERHVNWQTRWVSNRWPSTSDRPSRPIPATGVRVNTNSTCCHAAKCFTGGKELYRDDVLLPAPSSNLDSTLKKKVPHKKILQGVFRFNESLIIPEAKVSKMQMSKVCISCKDRRNILIQPFHLTFVCVHTVCSWKHRDFSFSCVCLSSNCGSLYVEHPSAFMGLIL